MNLRSKRILSLLLVISIMFGMLVFPVSATETESAAEVVVEETTESANEIPVQQSEEEVVETPDSPEAAASSIMGGETITAKGSYQLAPEASGVITIATTEPVTIIGNGTAWDENYGMTTTSNAGLSIDCTVAGVDLTIQDLYIDGPAGGYNAIDFMGVGNKLTLSGVNMLDNNMDYNNAAIHVPTGGSLSIGGTGTMYIYKSSGGAAIGGNTTEVNGDIVINGGTIFAKGTKTGAVIGSGQSAIGGSVTINGGNLYAMGNARGSCIGGGGYTGGVVGEGGAVTINGGNVMLVVNWSGAAIGGGGGNNSAAEQNGGTVVINGGSLKTRINSNAYSQWKLTAGENDPGYQINDIAITAGKLNGDNEAVYMLALSLADVVSNASGDKYVVKVDGKAFYSGNGYANTFSADTSSTAANWPLGDTDNCLYLYLSGKDHELEINGNTVPYYWNEEAKTFTTEAKTDILHGGETITADGTYQLAEDATGTITIAKGVKKVDIIGNGAQWDKDLTSATYGAVTSPANVGLMFDCTAAQGVTLTLKDVYISNEYINDNTIDFAGTGNTLIFDGTVVIDHDNNAAGYAGIHVGKDASLNIYGTSGSSFYMYKREQAAGIGANNREACGTLTFGVKGGKDDFHFYMKGTKQGAVIGNGANCPDTPGDITFYSGIYNMIANARGALIGGSAGPSSKAAGNVYVYGGLLNLNVDYSGAAIGGGGYDVGNDKGGGNVYLIGGSVRPYIDTNAVPMWASYGVTEAGVNPAAITAGMVNADNEPVYMLAVDTTDIAANTTGNSYVIKEGEKVYYSGERYGYCYYYENVDRNLGGNVYPNGTPGNWVPMMDDNWLYIYATGEDHVININGTDVTYYWDEVNETFSTVKKAVIAFAVDPEDVSIIVSDGIGYTYLENTHKGKFFEAVAGDEANEIEAVPAMTKFSLVPGEYTFTITRDGYYASTGSFKVSEELHAVSIASSSNINSYLKDDVFTIPMTAFVKSTNQGAWDGVTIDVSWYSETASELHISTPAQMAGMAAIVNGIYNAEITTIIDDVDGNGVAETYTPYDYAHLDGTKIIAANSGGSTGSNNLVTTSTYWYGAKSEGTYISGTSELAMPSDFRNQTVYIDCDLDMGGYQVDGEWTGARYMTIGGQSLMHYIEYAEWMSDGYSHIGSSFNGKLDGQGHIIKNMYCDRYATGSNYGDSVSVALVGRLGNHDGDPAEMGAVDPTVRNIAVTGYVYGRRSVGGIVGKTGHTSASKLKDGSTGAIIENCVNFAEIKNTDAKGVGGICGAGWNAGVIRNCANFGSIYAGRQNAGGICGSCELDVINCYNAGYVDAISYSQGQAIGTDNGGAVYTNVYWLTGSSIADSQDTYQYPAVYRHDSKDTLIEVESVAGFTASDFVTALNGNYRVWVTPAQTDGISDVLAVTGFGNNCKLDVTGLNAAGFPVPRCFVADTTTITSIDKIADPALLTYVAGQTFDPTGMQIQATWSDGTKELLEDYTISITRALETTDTVVTVSGTRGGVAYSFDFAITVAANELNTLEISTKPSNILYAQGETFDPTGMVVKATYTVAPSTKVTLSAEEYTYAVDGNVVTVSYTFAGKTMTATVELTILDTPAPSVDENGKYQLTSSNDVLWFANQIKAYKKAELSAVVMNDITVDASFPGIGTSSAKYAGTFDGEGYTLTLNMDVYSNAGLFTYVSGATIRNVVAAGTITNESSSAGIAGIAAYVDAKPTVIENCVNLATINGAGYAGGIVGKTNQSQLVITGCTNKGIITASNKYAGGIVGYLVTYSSNELGSAVSDCMNLGTVTCDNLGVGGIVGYIKSVSAAKNVSITNCGNEADVTGLYDVGGIVGVSDNAGDLISGCYNTGAVKATGSAANHGVGGIAGLAMANVQNSYNLGAVSSADAAAPATFGVGGIIGVIGTHYVKTNGITNAYNAGTVIGSGEAVVGAMAGYIRYTSVMTNCHYLENTASAAYGSIPEQYTVTGEPTAQTSENLKALAETLGEAFKADHPCHNDAYPVLVWQADASDLNNHSFGVNGFCAYCGAYDPDALMYTVSTAQELKTIADAVNAGDAMVGKIVTLAGDIDLSAVCGETLGSWEPIGGATENIPLVLNSQEELDAALETYIMIYDTDGVSYKKGASADKQKAWSANASYYYVSGKIFSGIFDGNGKTVSGLYINSDKGYLGLFGNVNGSIQNLTVKGSITCTGANGDYIGSIAGMLSQKGVIRNCVSHVTVKADKMYNVGGIVGCLGTKGQMLSKDDTFVLECVNYGSVTGFQAVGGMAGHNAGQIQRCANYGDIIATRDSGKGGVGGMVGRNGENNTATDSGTVIDCFNFGTIGHKDSRWSGGIVGFNPAASIVRNCYNVGSVLGSAQTNAICGQNEGTVQAGTGVYNCWYLESTRVFDASGVYGGYFENCGAKTEAEMKSALFASVMGASFNLDSDNINQGYPVLDWMGGTAAPAIYTVTIPSGGTGYSVTIAEDSETIVTAGGSFSFSVYTLEGYEIVSVKAGDTELTAVGGVYTIENINADVVVTIVVEEKQEEVVVKPDAPVVTASNVAKTGKIKLTWNAVEGAVKYEIYRATAKDGEYKKMYTTSGTSYSNTKATAGKYYYYYVVAIAEDGTVSDKSNIAGRTCDLAQPVATASNVAKTGKVKVTWAAVEGAVKYQVYRSDAKDGVYSRILTTTGTSCTNTKAEAGVTYYYKVVAVAEKSAANSAASAIVSRTCDLAQPVVTASNVAKTGKVKVTWTAVEGAVKYQVYRSDAKDGVYSRILTTTGTSCTNTKAEAGVTYYYKVVAIAEKSAANSAASAIVSRTCDLAQPKVTGSVNLAGNPKLSWDKVDGAVSYKVYRATSADGEYKLMKTTTGTSYTNTNHVNGRTYYYKVVAVCENTSGNSAASNVVKLTAK